LLPEPTLRQTYCEKQMDSTVLLMPTEIISTINQLAAACKIQGHDIYGQRQQYYKCNK